MHFLDLIHTLVDPSRSPDALTRGVVSFQFREAVERAISSYGFLADLDEWDTTVLPLAHHLLGQFIPRNRSDDVQALEFPFRYVGQSITPEARNVTVDDVRLYGKA